jgi:hypothetical protein
MAKIKVLYNIQSQLEIEFTSCHHLVLPRSLLNATCALRAPVPQPMTTEAQCHAPANLYRNTYIEVSCATSPLVYWRQEADLPRHDPRGSSCLHDVQSVAITSSLIEVEVLLAG